MTRYELDPIESVQVQDTYTDFIKPDIGKEKE